jgi:hypothetical protein
MGGNLLRSNVPSPSADYIRANDERSRAESRTREGRDNELRRKAAPSGGGSLLGGRGGARPGGAGVGGLEPVPRRRGQERERTLVDGEPVGGRGRLASRARPRRDDRRVPGRPPEHGRPLPGNDRQKHPETRGAAVRLLLGSPQETRSCAAQMGPTPHSWSRSGATSARSAASACSVSATSLESRSTRRPSRRRTSLVTSACGRSRAAARASRSPESVPRRSRVWSGAVTRRALSWLSAAVRACTALRRSSKSRRRCSRRRPPRGRQSPSPASNRGAARAESIRSLLARRRSRRCGRSHSHTGTPARSRKLASPAP